MNGDATKWAGRLPVLMYHRIAESDPTPRLAVTPKRFRQQMLQLSQMGMRAVGMRDCLGWLQGRNMLSPGAFVITFDDGYVDVYEHAAPVLQELAWPATVFLISDLIGKTDRWRQTHFPLMDIPQLRELAGQQITFHSHSRSHADMTTLSSQRLCEEALGSRQALEDMLGVPVDCFAYPYGRHDDRVVDAVRDAGYTAAFSVRSGFNRSGDNPFRLRRLDVFGSDSPAMLSRKVRLGSNDGSWGSFARYCAGQLAARFK